MPRYQFAFYIRGDNEADEPDPERLQRIGDPFEAPSPFAALVAINDGLLGVAVSEHGLTRFIPYGRPKLVTDGNGDTTAIVYQHDGPRHDRWYGPRHRRRRAVDNAGGGRDLNEWSAAHQLRQSEHHFLIVTS
jgi:hypothetical protein